MSVFLMGDRPFYCSPGMGIPSWLHHFSLPLHSGKWSDASMLLSQSGWKEPVFTLATSVSTLSRKRQREVRKAVTSCVREHGVVFLTASFEDSDSTASSMFFEDIFPAFFQYASGEDCFESDEYIHEALFEIGRITNIQHKKAFV